jgi:hypothetical protein
MITMASATFLLTIPPPPLPSNKVTVLLGYGDSQIVLVLDMFTVQHKSMCIVSFVNCVWRARYKGEQLTDRQTEREREREIFFLKQQYSQFT